MPWESAYRPNRTSMRVLSLAPSNTEILFALGLGDAVVGVTHFCDWPENAKTKPKVGAWIQTEPEKIAALKPDLIFTSYFIPEPLRAWNGPGKVVHVAPKTLGDVYESIRLIGGCVGAAPRAEKIVATMRSEFERIQTTLPMKTVRVYMEEWPEPPMASGNWVPELVEIAGGIAGVSTIGAASAEFQFEKLTTFNPDAMIFHWCGFGERFDPKRIAERPGWGRLSAVRDRQLFSIHDSLLNRPGPRLVEGVRKIQHILKEVANMLS